MDAVQIAEQAANYLVPALPYLLKGVKIAGKKAAEKSGEIIADDVPALATRLWDALRKTRSLTPKLTTAAKELAETPTDEDWIGLFVRELTTALKSKPELMREIEGILMTHVPEQSIEAIDNEGAAVTQTMLGTGKQRAKLAGNRKITVRQSIKRGS